MANNDGYALTWESEVENDSQFQLLNPGDAEFEVTDFQRGTNNKFGCPQAELKLKVTTGEGSTVIKENLILHSSMEWKICEFLRGIGQRKHGERVHPNWAKVVGAKGRCKINVREYEKDGEKRKINGVEKYYDAAEPAKPEPEPSF